MNREQNLYQENLSKVQVKDFVVDNYQRSFETREGKKEITGKVKGEG